jgi:hypothetical protein
MNLGATMVQGQTGRTRTDKCTRGARGRQKTKSVTPVVGGWVGQRPKRDQGQFFSDIFVWYILTPLTEKRPKTW